MMTSAFSTPTAAAAHHRRHVAGPRRAGINTKPSTRCVRSYAASGGSFPPGEVQPFGKVEVSQTSQVDTEADMLVLSLCEDDAADFAAEGDAVFEKFGEGLGAVVHDLDTCLRANDNDVLKCADYM